MKVDFVDRVYEAAFVPELWADITSDLAGQIDSLGSCLILSRGDGGVEWIASPRCSDNISRHRESSEAEQVFRDHLRGRHLRGMRFDRLGHRGFLTESHLLSAEELAYDPFQHAIRQDGVEWQAFSRIALPGDQIFGISVERGAASSPFGQPELEFLDSIYPHLVRAGSVTSHLGVERARASVLAMETIGFPAAVLDRKGVVVAANALFEHPQTPATTSAFGRVELLDVNASRKLAESLDALRDGHTPPHQTIPIAGAEGHAVALVHLLPIRRQARDVFSRGELMMVFSQVQAEALIPSPQMLNALFDLSPAEARLAARLSAGMPLRQAAADCGITISSARTYLNRIFRKTGTGQQSQLVALLKSVHPFPRPDRRPG